jgi:FlaA1/EpsC-like NDP-sugar epimerase
MNVTKSELSLLGRDNPLFRRDIEVYSRQLTDALKGSNCLVVGAAGTIGQAVTIELFKRNPASIHAVDLSENNLVELVRVIRSTQGYSATDFRTFAIDVASREFDVLVHSLGPYDYVFNLSALKHVRSEKDPYTLMRMIEVNVINTLKLMRITNNKSLKNYFCVSTDKAANPVNLMGASKRIMELFAMRESEKQNISMARFANVAFSDGSLLHGFTQRFIKRQPISAPFDVERYFLSRQESGELCMMSGLLGGNKEIFFPKLNASLDLKKFSDIAQNYLTALGYEVFLCESENEARRKCSELIEKKKWPCYFFASDTTGEKPFEEFYTGTEDLILDKFESIGIIENKLEFDEASLDDFLIKLDKFQISKSWDKKQILEIFNSVLPNFEHIEKGKNLDQRM